MKIRLRTSKVLRQTPLFLRNEYKSNNEWGIPDMRACHIYDPDIQLLSFKSTVSEDKRNVDKVVHFFIDDYDFEKVYLYPQKYVLKLAQYSAVFTPDFSLYSDMPEWKQLSSIAKSRWCGCYWQDLGLNVIPTVSWSTPSSYSFAFLGLEKGTTVALSTVGARRAKKLFISGYNELMEKISPDVIYCYGKPFPEMQGNIITIDYLETTRRAG